MDKFDKLFSLDKTTVDNGAEYPIDDESSITVRYLDSMNPRIKAAFAKYFKPYERQIAHDTLAAEKDFEIRLNLFIDVCLAGWKGITINSQPVECTPENAKKFLVNKRPLFDDLWKFCNNYTNYRVDAGNDSQPT